MAFALQFSCSKNTELPLKEVGKKKIGHRISSQPKAQRKAVQKNKTKICFLERTFYRLRACYTSILKPKSSFKYRMPTAQDLPREGGFPKIQYRRNLPNKGPTGAVILGTIAVAMTYGWYRVYLGLEEKRELQRETTYSRVFLLPMLAAETHRDEYRRHLAAMEREKSIMKDVVGWSVGKGVYHTDRHIPASIPNIPLSQKPQ